MKFSDLDDFNILKIYVGHSSHFDYEKELYAPLKDSAIGEHHRLILPHDVSHEPHSTKNSVAVADLFVAEVSYPSTGLGIELGWAHDLRIPILCMYRHGQKPSSSLKLICEDFIEYSSPTDMINKLADFLKR